MQQRRIRPEPLRPAMKLPRITHYNLPAPTKGPHHPADPNILLPILTQIPDSLPIAVRAHHSKPAFFIRRLRTAKIKKSRSIGQFHHVVNMRRYANVLVLVGKCVFRGVAGLFGKQRNWTQ